MTNTEPGERWYAFVRYAGDEHEREGYVFDSYGEALTWRDCAAAERPGVVASGLLPEAVRTAGHEFMQRQRRDL